MTRAFTPRAIERLRGSIRLAVDAMLDPIAESGPGRPNRRPGLPLPADMAIATCSVCQPTTTKSSSTGPTGWRAGWTWSAPRRAVVEAGNDAAQRLSDYFRELIADHRAQPRDDLLESLLIAAEEDGDRLSEDELLATCAWQAFAGHGDGVNLVGSLAC